MVPKKALDYIKNKNLARGFSYKDIWNEEHATNFTVAKAMQLDVLKDLKGAVEKAIEEGIPFSQFQKNLKPTLIQKDWWGTRDMLDPVTGKIVKNAQLGSPRRLKTIYDTNLRSAYQEGRWERSQESTAHPYLMYRVGPSKKHRDDHLAWDRLILPKDDPWWNSHYPPNGWGYKCWTQAVSEARKQRLEKEGVKVPPSVDGRPGYTAPVKTKAPPDNPRLFFNERKNTIEQVPAGVDPAFNSNVGIKKRLNVNLENVVQKTQRDLPEQYDQVISSLITGRIYKARYYDFVDDAYKKYEINRVDKRNTIPAGFLDEETLKFLKKEKMNFDGKSLIFLEEELITNAKYIGHHVLQENYPKKSDWYNLIDYLNASDVFYEKEKNGLIYLYKQSESKYIKIAVDLSFQHKGHKGAKLLLPKIDTMYELDITAEIERGITEYRRIMKLEKIR